MKRILLIIFTIVALNSLYSQEITHTFSFNRTEKSISLTIKNETAKIMQVDNGRQTNPNIVCYVYKNNSEKFYDWYSLANKGKYIELKPYEKFQIKIDMSRYLNKIEGDSIEFEIFLAYITESNLKATYTRKAYKYAL